MDVHRDIPLDQFRDAMKQALKDDPRIDGSSPVEINPLIVSEDTYNVAITAWMKGTLEEPGKAVLINKAIEVVKELRRRAGTGAPERTQDVGSDISGFRFFGRRHSFTAAFHG
jgi:hypothetical protein